MIIKNSNSRNLQTNYILSFFQLRSEFTSSISWLENDHWHDKNNLIYSAYTIEILRMPNFFNICKTRKTPPTKLGHKIHKTQLDSTAYLDFNYVLR